jgi:hypothetical protein
MSVCAVPMRARRGMTDTAARRRNDTSDRSIDVFQSRQLARCDAADCGWHVTQLSHDERI